MARTGSSNTGLPPLPDAPVARLTRPLVRFMHVESASGVVLLVCTLIAIFAANSPWSEQWASLWSTTLRVGVGGFELAYPARYWVNDALMVIFFFVVGLVLLDVIRVPWSGPGRVNSIGRGAPAAFLLGLIFGVALGPCTFAFMAPMLAVALGAAAERPVYGALLLLLYGVGHCSVIVLAGTFTEIVQRYMNWNERSRGATIVRRVCGVLVILGGVYLIWTTI